jgi:hypothetical protein
LLALALGYGACMLTTGLMRHSADPLRFPLIQRRAGLPLPAPETYNPGRNALATWIDWRCRSVGDFRPIFVAAQERARDPSASLYRPHELSEHKASFVYTPFTAMLLSPWAGDRSTLEQTADRVSIANHLLAIAGFALLYSVLARANPGGLGLAAVFALHCVLFYPMASALHLTQAGVWIFFALCVSIWAQSRGRPLLSGLALAAGASIKPHLVALPILLALVPGTSARFLAGAGAGLLATATLSLAYAGWENCRDYVFETLPSLSAGYSYFHNQGFNGLLLRIFTDQSPAEFNLAEPVGWIRKASTLLGIALLLATLYACRKRAPSDPDRDEQGLVYGALLAAVVLASPVCWIHHFILLAIPLVAVVRALRAGSGNPLLTGLVVCSGLMLGFLFDASGLRNGWPSVFSGLELYGALGLLGCLVWILARRRSQCLGA